MTAWIKPLLFVVFGLGMAAVSLARAEAAQVGDLRCEYKTDPVGIGTSEPHLSWVMTSDRRGDRQTGYRILVADDPALLDRNQGNLWDSGQVTSNQSIQVPYKGKALTSGQRCWWKVRLLDADGRPTAWSEPACWTMALLAVDDWKGKWIGLDESESDGAEKNPLKAAQWVWYPEGSPAASAPIGERTIRRAIELPADAQIAKATCFVTADNEFELRINGQAVGNGTNFKQIFAFDVTRIVRPGENAVSIEADNVGPDANPAGVIAMLRVELQNGEKLEFPTDGSWQALLSSEADDWKPAMVLGPCGMGPWNEISISTGSRVLPARMLRREFALADKPIKRAMASICGVGYYELYLNGEKVGDHQLDPALSEFPKRAYFVTYDVTDQIQGGENAAGVWLGNGRYYAPRTEQPTFTKTFGYPKALVQLDVEYADGSRERIVSDEQWKLTTDGPIRANNDYDGETYDARMELPGWSAVGFDDASWQPARGVGPAAEVLTPQMIQPMRVTEILKPIAVSQPEPGVFIYDMGQNMVGVCRLKVEGPAGTNVTLRHAETIKEDGTLYLANIRGAKVTDTYILKGDGPEVYQPRFTYHGFRYVELCGYPGEPALDAIEGLVIHTDVPTAGTFECSNKLLNQIYSNIRWGVRGNYLSVSTDCPQRDERQGWLGDTAGRSKGESYFLGVQNFFAKWVGDMEDAQNAEGNVPDVVPSYWPLYNGDVTWPSAYIIIPDWYYDQFADVRIIADHYDSLARWMDFLGKRIQPDGTLPASADQYGDWCVPPERPELIHSQDPARKTPGDYLATVYYIRNLRIMERFASLLGKTDDQAKYAEQAEQMRQAFQKKYYDAEHGYYANGAQTTAVLALYFDLVPEDLRGKVFSNLVDNIENKCDGHLGTGLIGGQWLMRTLTDNGRPDLAYKLASNTTYPSWGYMVENDATTIWELWNGNTADPAMNSHNHQMLVGDLAIWFYECLGGIKSDSQSPGFKRIVMHPRPVEGLEFVNATHQSPYGPIVSRWKKQDGRFVWDVEVPVGSTAEVYLPTEDADSVQESGQPAAQSAGVKLLRNGDGVTVYEVSSGKYQFSCPLAE